MGILYRDLVRKHSGKIKGSARAVLNVLADYANDDGLAWPTRATIANDSGLSERTVVRCLQTLADRGHLAVTEHAKGGRGRVPVYQIIIVDGDQKGDNVTERVTERHPLPEERVTDCPIKGDILTQKGDNVTIKGDNLTSPYSEYNRSKPNIEPNEEPGEGAQAPGPLPVTHEFVLGLCAVCHGHKSPEQLTEAMRAALSVEAGRMVASGFDIPDLRAWWATYKSDDWRWKKGKQRPKPHDVRTSITKATSGYVLDLDPSPPVAPAPPSQPVTADVLDKPAEPTPLPARGDVWATALYDLRQMQNLTGDVGILDGSRLEHVGRERDCEIYRVLLAKPDYAGYASRRLIPQLRRAVGIALGGMKVIVTVEYAEPDAHAERESDTQEERVLIHA